MFFKHSNCITADTDFFIVDIDTVDEILNFSEINNVTGVIITTTNEDLLEKK